MRNAIEIAADIRKSDVWDYELCTELCKAADMEEEWEAASAGDYDWNSLKPPLKNWALRSTK